MEIALLNYFVLNDTLKSTCDFNLALLQSGKQVYEVVRIIKGKPLFFKDHLKRFYDSASNCGIRIKLQPAEVTRRIRLLIEYNKMVQGNIEFVCHLNEFGEQNFLAWCAPFRYPTAEQYAHGVSVTAMQAERTEPNVKAFNKHLRKEADRIIREKGVYEVILINRHGILTEGSRSNLFFIHDDALVTPPVSEVLPGVTRSHILRLCREQNIAITETEINLKGIKNYRSMFLSGTSPKILPVHRFNEILFDVNNPLLRRLMKKLDYIIERDIEAFDFDAVF